MLLKRLRLYQFRCYEELEIEPDLRFNVISGFNGEGKTSLLESIGLLCFLRSFRNAKNNEMLRIGSETGLISGSISNGDIEATLAVKLWDKKKQATFNGKPCKYLSEYVGQTSAVSFCPSDLEIVRGSPEHRRAWLDKASQVLEPVHIDISRRYIKVLQHRNKELKALSERRIAALPSDFEVWSEELVSLGAKVIHNRIHTVDKSVDNVRKYYSQISNQDHKVTIQYLSEIFSKDPYGQANQSSLEIISRSLRKSLEASFEKEKIIGSTQVGPHRDDLEFKLDGKAVRTFGSQGEIRSLILAMRLAEVEIYNSFRGLKPILLIDDFSSELDEKRRGFLLDYLDKSDSQVFLSTTEKLEIGKQFLISEGRVAAHGC